MSQSSTSEPQVSNSEIQKTVPRSETDEKDSPSDRSVKTKEDEQQSRDDVHDPQSVRNSKTPSPSISQGTFDLTRSNNCLCFSSIARLIAETRHP